MNTKHLVSVCILLSVLSADFIYSAKPLDGLRTLVSSDGAVVFVRPQTMDCISGGGKPLDYDWTISTMSDTVSFTFSVVTETPVDLDSLSLLSPGNGRFERPLEKLYAEPKGSRWIYRMRAPFSLGDFAEISGTEDAPVLKLKGLPYSYRIKKWQECKAVYNLALNIIKENKK